MFGVGSSSGPGRHAKRGTPRRAVHREAPEQLRAIARSSPGPCRTQPITTRTRPKFRESPAARPAPARAHPRAPGMWPATRIRSVHWASWEAGTSDRACDKVRQFGVPVLRERSARPGLSVSQNAGPRVSCAGRAQSSWSHLHRGARVQRFACVRRYPRAESLQPRGAPGCLSGAAPMAADIPAQAGLYRDSGASVSTSLAYVGQTGSGGMTFRKRLGMLRGVYGDVMPCNDPHTAGVRGGLGAAKCSRSDFEASTCAVDGDAHGAGRSSAAS